MSHNTINLTSLYFKACNESTRVFEAERSTKKGDVKITVQSPCLGIAANVASDLIVSHEYGGGHAMKEALIDRIAQANEKRQGLACTIHFS